VLDIPQALEHWGTTNIQKLAMRRKSSHASTECHPIKMKKPEARRRKSFQALFTCTREAISARRGFYELCSRLGNLLELIR
jgi:hypothetical protein